MNIKTAPLIRSLLDSINDGLNTSSPADFLFLFCKQWVVSSESTLFTILFWFLTDTPYWNSGSDQIQRWKSPLIQKLGTEKVNSGILLYLNLQPARPGGYKFFFMLISAEHEFCFLLINLKLLTVAFFSC